MKTIIDSKQAERLKEVCEKHGVKLPETEHEKHHYYLLKYFRTDEPERNFQLSLTELLDWLPKTIEIKNNKRNPNLSIEYVDNYSEGRSIWVCSYGGVIGFVDECLIGGLLDLFIWTIDNNYYRGV